MNSILPLVGDEDWPAELAGQIDGNILNIHRIIAHNPALAEAYAPLRNYIVRGGSLSLRQVELLILRTACNVDSEYEWAHHVVRGRAAGLTDKEIECVRSHGASHTSWSELEQALLTSADEMHAHQKLSHNTADILHKHLGRAALLDAIFTIGVYLTLGTVLVSFDVPIDDTIAPLL